MNSKTAADHLIFVEGAGKTLVKSDRLKGPIAITPKGIACYDQLMAAGWKPKRKIVRWIVADKMGLRSRLLKLEEMTDLIMSVADECQSAG